MTSTKQTCVLAVAAALLAGSEGFVPSGSVRTAQHASRATTTTMKAQGPKANAAAFLAGVLSIGAAFETSPVDAALFDASSTPALQRDVGFGQPNPDSDPKNNNAESGRENGPKYDIQQQGKFAEKNSAGAVDYGSPKGTDFGNLSGGKSGVATETKATDGDYLADAKSNTRGGTKIAPKNTKDAANIDVKDVRTSGKGTLGDGIQQAKNAVTGGASNSAAPTWGGVQGLGKAAKDTVASAGDNTGWGKPSTGTPNNAKVPAKSLNNGFTSSFRAVPGAVSDAASAVENKVKSDVKTATRATSDLGKGNQVASSAKSGAQDAASAAKNKVSSDISATKSAADNVGADGLQNAAAQAKNAVTSNAGDVKSAVKDAVGAEKGSPASTLLSSTLVSNAVTDAASSVENKVKSDVKTATRATSDLRDLNKDASLVGKGNQVTSSAKSGAQDAASAAKNKVSSDISATKSAADNVGADGLQNAAAQAKNAATNNAGDVKSAVKNAVGVEKGSPASTLLSSTLLSNAEPEGGFLGTAPREAAAISGQKTVDKVKSDIATARANPPFQGETTSNSAGNAANNAANAVKSKVGQDVGNTRQQWQYVKREVDRNTPNANQAKNAVANKVKSDINTVDRNTPNSFEQAKNAVVGKVQSDINTVDRNTPNSIGQAGNAVKSKVDSDVKSVARATPDTPKIGGFFGLQPREQAQTAGRKTADKVKSDVDAVSSGLPQTGGDLGSAVRGAVSRATN